MKIYTPLDGLRWSRNSDSALNNMPQTDVLGRAGGGKQSTFNRLVRSIPQKRHEKIIQESETYINRVYYNNYEQEK